MKVYITDKKLKTALEDEAICRKRYGAEMAKKLAVRMAEFTAAKSLLDFWPPKSKPERCHELEADQAGIFSVDLKHPYRLLFKPIEDPSEMPHNDERQRWSRIESIEILYVKDTHG